MDSRVHSSQKHQFDLRDKQGHAAFRANKLVGEMFSTMLTITRPRPPVPASDQPHLLFTVSRHGYRRGEEMWRDGCGGAGRCGHPQSSVLSPQCRPDCRRGQWPAEAQCTTGSTRTRHHWTLCVVTAERGPEHCRISHAVMLQINIVSTKVSFVHIAVVVAVVSQSM